jgi:hypothetical protein
MDKSEEKIRALAYDFWMQDGQQAGKAEYYWWLAERQLAESGDLDRSKESDEVRMPPAVSGLAGH